MAAGSLGNVGDKRLWTVMIYLAGDNNLSGEMIYAIKEMKRVEKIGPNEPVTVIVLFDPSHGLPSQGYVITPGEEDNQLIDEAELFVTVIDIDNGEAVAQTLQKNPVVTSKSNTRISRINTGAPETLIQFINYCLDNYPAERYAVILSGHGSGADEDFLLKDDSARDSLTISELKKVFTDVKKKLEKSGRAINILGLDSCLMSMAEVYYELSNIEPRSDKANNTRLVDFLVGAEGVEMNVGWPYQRILAPLAATPNMDPETFAMTIVEAYILYYSDYALAGQS